MSLKSTYMVHSDWLILCQDFATEMLITSIYIFVFEGWQFLNKKVQKSKQSTTYVLNWLAGECWPLVKGLTKEQWGPLHDSRW